MTGTRWNWVVGLLLIMVGCSPSGTVDDTLEPSRSSSTASLPTSTSAINSTSPSSTLRETTTTTLATTTTTTLAGREIDVGPSVGMSLAVIGVEHDDVLNVRAGPGVNERVLMTAAPTSEGLIAQGRTRITPDGALWTEVELDQIIGWVHLGYVATIGSTNDVTAQVVSGLGEYPTASSMVDLGRLVSTMYASLEPVSRIVMVADSEPGDVRDVTFDVIGVGDDAIRGYRIRVFAVAVSDGLGFHSAELTTLCGRGVTDDGLCI